MQNINYTLLAVLATVSWIGLCVFSSATWTEQDQSFRTTSTTTRSAPRVIELIEQPDMPDNGWSNSIWLIALIVNVCVYLAFHFIKRALVCICWKLEKLNLNALTTGERANVAATDQAQTLQHIDQHLHVVRQSQASLLALVHNIRSATNNSCQTALTSIQQANMERSLFYLQQIAKIYRFRTAEDRARDPTATKTIISRRRSIRSSRSELILKRISQQLIQPIGMRYNAICRQTAMSQQHNEQTKQVRRIRSCSDAVDKPKHPATGDRRMLENANRKPARGLPSRRIDITYRKLSQ